MSVPPVRDDHRCAIEPMQPLSWRKSRHSPAGAGAACVQTLPLDVRLAGDGSVVLVPPGTPRPELTQLGRLDEIRGELAGFRSELEGWGNRFASIRERGLVPLQSAHLLNRAEHLVPDLLERFASMARLIDRPLPTLRNYETVARFLRGYREGSEGRGLLEQAHAEAVSMDAEAERQLLLQQRSALSGIVSSGERHFGEHLAAPEPEIAVYRGAGADSTVSSSDLLSISLSSDAPVVGDLSGVRLTLDPAVKAAANAYAHRYRANVAQPGRDAALGSAGQLSDVGSTDSGSPNGTAWPAQADAVREYTESGVDLVTAVAALGRAFEQSDEAHRLLKGPRSSQSADTVAAAELRVAEARRSLAAAETRFDGSLRKLEELDLARVAEAHELGSAEQSGTVHETGRLLGRPKIVIGTDEESGRVRVMQWLLREQVVEQVREGDFNEARLLAEAFGPALFTKDGLMGGSLEIRNVDVTKLFRDESRRIETEMQLQIAKQRDRLGQIESRERQLSADVRRVGQGHDAKVQDIRALDQANYGDYARERESLQRKFDDLERSRYVWPRHVWEERAYDLAQVRTRSEARRAAQVHQLDGLRAQLERDRKDATADFAARRAALADQRFAVEREITSLQREMVRRQRDHLTALVERFKTGLRLERDTLAPGIVPPRRLESGEWAEYNFHLPQIEAKLRKIIIEPTGHNGYHELLEKNIGKHPDFGAKMQNVKVNNNTELARGLLGWVKAKPNRHKEKLIAQRIYGDGSVEKLLDVLITRVNSLIMGLPNGRRIARELASGRSEFEPDKPLGSYLPANRQSPQHLRYRVSAIHEQPDGLMALMRNPTRFTMRDKMMVLHDLWEYFGAAAYTPRTHGTDLLPVETDSDVQSTIAVDASGYRTNSSKERGRIRVRQPDGTSKTWTSTRDEDAPSTILARERDIPVWAGQSLTAVRMFKLAEWAGGSKLEIAAVAYGIFAFWRLDYNHTTEFAYHTLHEILDVAQNFGISYTMNDQAATLTKVSWSAAHREAKSLAQVLRSGTLPPSARNWRLSRYPDHLQALGSELSGFRRAVDLAPNDSDRLPAIASLLTKLEQVKVEVGIDTSLRSDALGRPRTMSLGRRGTGPTRPRPN